MERRFESRRSLSERPWPGVGQEGDKGAGTGTPLFCGCGPVRGTGRADPPVLRQPPLAAAGPTFGPCRSSSVGEPEHHRVRSAVRCMAIGVVHSGDRHAPVLWGRHGARLRGRVPVLRQRTEMHTCGLLPVVHDDGGGAKRGQYRLAAGAGRDGSRRRQALAAAWCHTTGQILRSAHSASLRMTTGRTHRFLGGDSPYKARPLLRSGFADTSMATRSGQCIAGWVPRLSTAGRLVGAHARNDSGGRNARRSSPRSPRASFFPTPRHTRRPIFGGLTPLDAPAPAWRCRA